MYITEIGRISLAQSEKLLKFPNLIHGFTTRTGGVSTGEYESLSMSPRRGDNPVNVRENEKILCNDLKLDINKLSSTMQEHTDVVKIINKSNIGTGVHKPWSAGVDGVITREKDVPVMCYSADCVPVLMYADDIGAVGAVHAGWRGTKAGIVKNALEMLLDMGAKEENIYIAVGPAIGKCCYEVGIDVAQYFPDKYRIKKPGEKYMLDLPKVNFDYARLLNIPEENISMLDICTRCNNHLFFSHRGQKGKSGTLAGIICMR